MPELPPELQHTSAVEAFEQAAWGDLWRDADMPRVVAYLLGNRGLSLPRQWRMLFPDKL